MYKRQSLIRAAVPGKYRKAAITPEASLQKDLGLDSLAVIALVFRFEEAFGIDLRGVDLQLDLARLRTVGDVLATGKDILRQVGPAGS